MNWVVAADEAPALRQPYRLGTRRSPRGVSYGPLERRPGDRGAVAVGEWEAAASQERIDPAHRGADFGGGEQLAQLCAQVGGEGRSEPSQYGSLFLVEGVAAPAPQDRPQLRFHGEAEAVVDGLDSAAFERQQMSTLAIGVVEDGVEDRDSTQFWQVETGQLHDVDGRIDFPPQLHHSGPERTVAHDRRRDYVAAARHRNAVSDAA